LAYNPSATAPPHALCFHGVEQTVVDSVLAPVWANENNNTEQQLWVD